MFYCDTRKRLIFLIRHSDKISYHDIFTGDLVNMVSHATCHRLASITKNQYQSGNVCVVCVCVFSLFLTTVCLMYFKLDGFIAVDPRKCSVKFEVVFMSSSHF